MWSYILVMFAVHYIDKDDAFCKALGSVQMGLLDK